MQDRADEWTRWSVIVAGPMLALGLVWSVTHAAPAKGKTPVAKHTSCCAPAQTSGGVPEGMAGAPSAEASAGCDHASGSKAAGTCPTQHAMSAKPAPHGQTDRTAPGAESGRIAAPSKAVPGAPLHGDGCPMHPKP